MENEIQKNRNYINADSFDSNGNGVVVAILDTGCAAHPYLNNKIIGGINTTNDGKSTTDYMRDTIGHGTQVAGVIAQIAPEAKLMILKYKGDSMLAFTNEALEFALNWCGPNGETIRVVNISQSWGNSPTADELVREAVKKGILVIAAAGNEGDDNPVTDEVCYPAYLPEAIAVGAYDHNQNKIWSNSNSNDRIDLIAPGRRIVTTSLMSDDWNGQKGWMVASGTSIATPFVSGAAALIISKFEKELGRRLTLDEITYELFKRTVDMEYDRRLQGHGMLDLSIDSNNFGLPKHVQMWHEGLKRLPTVGREFIDEKIKEGYTLDIPNHHERQQMIDDLLRGCE